ncbi:MAG: PDZ domain-containing protein [bacterium]
MLKHLGKRILIGIVLTVFVAGTASMGNASKSSRKGYLGVSIEKLSSEERKEMGVSHGVVVTKVEKDGPAERAGIVEEDVILYFAGKKIRTTQNLTDAVRETKPKTDAKVTLMCDGQRKDIIVTVGRLPSLYSYSFGSGKDNFITVFGGRGGYLGVSLQELNADLADYFGVKEDGGALVLNVVEDSPAAKAGMKAGDVIIVIDEEEIGCPEDVHEIISDFEEGDEVDIVILRHGQKQTLKVELDERSPHSDIQIFKGIGKGNFRLNVPQIERLEMPKYNYHLRWDEDARKHLEEQLENLRERIDSRLDRVELKLKTVVESRFI